MNGLPRLPGYTFSISTSLPWLQLGQMFTSTCTETSRSGRQLQGYDDWIWPLCARNAKGIRLPATRCPWAVWHIQPIAFRTVLVEQFYSVPHHQCVQFVWQGEHHMEIFHREQLVHTRFHPLLLLLPVTGRAMTVTASVILIMHVMACGIIALKPVIAHSRCPAIAQLCQYTARVGVRMGFNTALLQHLLQGMSRFQSRAWVLGILAISLTGLYSSSSGLTSRFRFELCKWR